MYFLYTKVIYSRFTASQTIGERTQKYATSVSETIETGIVNDTLRQRKQDSKMKAMTKQQLAARAGVTVRTLLNWCKPYQKELTQMGMTPGMRVLPPNIVIWIAERFCIDVE